VDWINPTGARKVHSLIDKVYQRKNLEVAWEMVKANRGSGGVDGQSLDGFAAQLDQQLDRLQSELKDVSGGGRWGHYGGTRWGHPANSRWQRVDHPESKLASEGESAPSAVTGDPNNSFERRASPSNSQACLCEAKQELKQPTGSEENNHEIPEDFA